jgi:hypothetical protein
MWSCSAAALMMDVVSLGSSHGAVQSTLLVSDTHPQQPVTVSGPLTSGGFPSHGAFVFSLSFGFNSENEVTLYTCRFGFGFWAALNETPLCDRPTAGIACHLLAGHGQSIQSKHRAAAY